MIVRLLPEQISEQWPILRYALEQALPPFAGGGEDRSNRLLESLLIGTMDCWIVYHMEGERVAMEAAMFTTPTVDSNTGGVNLMIYALYGFQPIPPESWSSNLQRLCRWARAQGYDKLVAYTNSRSILEMTKRLGGNAEYTFITFDVKEVAGESL